MTKPQQNELRRSGLGGTDDGARKAALSAEGTPGSTGGRPGHPVPTANLPGELHQGEVQPVKQRDED